MLRVLSSLLLRPAPLLCVKNLQTQTYHPLQSSCVTAQRWNLVTRGLRASATIRGLEEFFPRTDNPIEEGEKSGRPWLARELRHKSNEDLHKLWYVLLKERNMLLTVKQEANRELYIMPGPERLRKVRRSMARIKVVLFEREVALKQAKLKLEGVEDVKPEVQRSHRKIPYKLRKMFLKRARRLRRVKQQYFTSDPWEKPPLKKRRNVRNYKHLEAVRELEKKEHL